MGSRTRPEVQSRWAQRPEAERPSKFNEAARLRSPQALVIFAAIALVGQCHDRSPEGVM